MALIFCVCTKQTKYESRTHMLGEAAFVITFFIESHDARDAQSLEHGHIVVHTEREHIGTNSPSFIIWAAAIICFEV